MGQVRSLCLSQGHTHALTFFSSSFTVVHLILGLDLAVSAEQFYICIHRKVSLWISCKVFDLGSRDESYRGSGRRSLHVSFSKEFVKDCSCSALKTNCVLHQEIRLGLGLSLRRAFL